MFASLPGSASERMERKGWHLHGPQLSDYAGTNVPEFRAIHTVSLRAELGLCCPDTALIKNQPTSQVLNPKPLDPTANPKPPKPYMSLQLNPKPLNPTANPKPLNPTAKP